MSTIVWWSFALLGFILLCWYFETVYEMYLNWKNGRKSRKDRQNERFIQKVDRYYHEV